jgi:putative transposase
VRTALVIKPSTMFHFHRVLAQGKYRLHFSPKQRAKPGPRGPNADLIRAVVAMEQRNPMWGCPRIAQQITLAFGIPIKLIRMGSSNPGHALPTGARWSGYILADIPRQYERQPLECGSIAMRIRDLRTYWVMVVMDQYSRRIIGFGIQAGVVDGVALCLMFKQAIRAR